MTPAPPSARGRDDAYEDDGYWDSDRDDERDDGSVATFAPALPRLPRRRSVPATRDLPRSGPPRTSEPQTAPPQTAPPRSEPSRSAPPPEPAPPAPPRPSSPLAELFAEEEEEEKAAARPARRWGNDRPAAEPARPAVKPARPAPAATAVTVRAEPREDADEPEVAAEPIWVGVARGVAATLAAGALTGAALILKAAGAGGAAGPAWLADLAPLPTAALAPLLAFCGTGLGLFAVKTNLPTPPRWGATLAAAAVAGGALKVAITGGLAGGFGPSLAWHLVICAGLILAATRWSPGAATASAGRLAPLIGLLVCGLTFPLADGTLADVPAERRGPAASVRAIAGWWGDALRFDRPTDEAPDGLTDVAP